MTVEPEPDLRIGRLIKAHGVKGALRLELLTDFPDRFAAGREVRVGGRRLRVAQSQEQDGSMLVTFEGIDDRTAAEPLVGSYVTVPLADARPLPPDQYYHFQLVGLRVVDARRARELGKVEEVLSYAANDVLRVTDGKQEILIPMIHSVVRSIAPAEGTITVDLPPETTP